MPKFVGVALRALVGRAGLAGLALCAALAMAPGAAKAVNVTVGGVTYDIQYFDFNRSFDDDQAALMLTPWWNNPTLADDIADAYLAQIGVAGAPFNQDAGFGTSLWFAYEEFVLVGTDFVRRADLNEGDPGFAIAPSVVPNGSVSQNFASSVGVYAHGTIVAAAVPEIDGNALFKALFCLFTLALWLQVRRNRRTA